MAAQALARELVREMTAQLEKYAEQSPELVRELKRRRALGGEDIVSVARDMLGLLMAHALPPEPADVWRGLQAFNKRQGSRERPVESMEWLDDVTGERHTLARGVESLDILTPESRQELAKWVAQLSGNPDVDEEPPPPHSNPSPGGI